MSIKSELQGSFLAGLLLVAPLAVTIVVLQFVVVRLGTLLNPVVEGTRLTNYTGGVQPAAQLLAALLLALTVTLLGFLAQRSIGQRLFGGFDRLVGIVPLVSTIYTGVRQVATALTNRSSQFERVVLVEYPQTDIYALGFVTAESPEAIASVVGEPAVHVFAPNSPNPTGGKLLVVPESRVHPTTLSVRRGLRLVMTTGVAETEADVAALDDADGSAAPQ